MTGAHLPICSIFFSVLLLFVYFYKKRIKLKENNLYVGMLIVSVIDSVLVSILQILPANGITSTEMFWIKWFNRIDFFMLIAFTNFIFLYVLLITYESVQKKYKAILTTSIIIDIIASFLSMLGSFKVITENGHYSVGGTSLLITIFLCATYIVFALIVTLTNYKKLDKRYIPIFAIIGTIVVLMIMFKINPYLIVISITATFINYIMYFTIENPDVKMLQQVELARDQANRANRAKTDFLSSMSHEIRTPLNAIVGFSDYIITSDTLEEAQDNAKDIINASQTLLEIVNGILDISKIESGKLEIVNSNYNSRSTFEALAKLVTPKMREKNLDFTYYIAPDLPETLFGDQANIKKIITNLLSNAYKYTSTGSIRYEVNCINSGNISKLIITVEDTGRGIRKEDVDKLFAKFERIDEDKNTTTEGTGLGLAITKQLIELMGGKILVHTVYGEGSKFTVVLNQNIEKEEVKEEIVVNTTLDLKDKKILIVDDNLLNIKVATKILERFNANSITALENGFDVIENIKAGNVYDIILMDDMMPKMSGIETFHKLQELPGFNQPVVVLTANAITGMKEKYLKEGFEEYLAKPIEKDELIRVCNTIFAKYSGFEETMFSEPAVKTVEQEENNTEKVSQTVEEEELELISPEVDNEVDNPESSLKNQGVDLDKALEFLGDIEMYKMTLADFLTEVEEKWQMIISYKESNDMENYAIEVHSLKSDAKYLGFMSLAEVAYNHELKSKENDSEYVNEHFTELESEFTKYLAIAKEYNSRVN